MSQTSRELVGRCLRFESPDRVPRHLWVLPWASAHHPEAVSELQRLYADDIIGAPSVCGPSSRERGDAYREGEYTDDWGCLFRNIQAGLIGEVKEPLLPDLADRASIRPPYETFPVDASAARDRVNRFCGETDRFVMAGGLARPWERYQFIRGTENSLIDIMEPGAGCADLLKTIHRFYLEEMEFWAGTDVDALFFMDDWGAQNRLLIPPRIWRELFKPLYRDYCDLAHANGKSVFMHSDGNILEIYEDLIEIGVDAINSQLFCMDFEELRDRAKGKITFWGEIDRQHVLPSKDPQAGRDAVRKVARYLYDPRGGIIAQFEFGAGAEPETALALFDEWDRISLREP
jgi:uroporphyrinogen decarboxylase